MKKTICRLLPVVCAGLFVVSGCAKEEVVRKDEPLAPAVARTSETAPATQAEATPKTPAKQPAAPVANPGPSSAGEQANSSQAAAAAAPSALGKALEKIYFDYDAATLTHAARQTLTRNFDLLKKDPRAKVRIEGNCDERGSDEYNLALGERRAQAAALYLTTLGIPAERLSTISYGKEKPADPGHDEAAWARNRRDELAIIR